jgi:hypothetical protein
MFENPNDRSIQEAKLARSLFLIYTFKMVQLRQQHPRPMAIENKV